MHVCTMHAGRPTWAPAAVHMSGLCRWAACLCQQEARRTAASRSGRMPAAAQQWPSAERVDQRCCTLTAEQTQQGRGR